MNNSINSTETFIRRVFKAHAAGSVELFYRGHSNGPKFRLKPRLFRSLKYKENEDRLFRELLMLNPSEFAGDSSTLEKLVRMQHHSLPTRLLDITSNPLIALYFACKESKSARKKNIAGEVIVFKIHRKNIKFYDSDTASCVANLAKLNSGYKREIDTSLSKVTFNEEHVVQLLLHFIKEEKPYFQSVINPKDLNSVICVRTKFSNSRICSQVGASLLFGLDAELPEVGNTDIRIERISINGKAKSKILKELDTLNINESTVFPYIENSAKYLAKKYLTPQKNMDAQ